MSKRRQIPVEDPNELSPAQRAVEEMKGQRGRSKTRHQLMQLGEKTLNQARDEKARGLHHYAENGDELETIDQVMAHVLAGKKVEARKPDDEEPETTVTKATKIEGT